MGPRSGLDRCGKSRPCRDSIVQPVASRLPPVPTACPVHYLSIKNLHYPYLQYISRPMKALNYFTVVIIQYGDSRLILRILSIGTVKMNTNSHLMPSLKCVELQLRSAIRLHGMHKDIYNFCLYLSGAPP